VIKIAMNNIYTDTKLEIKKMKIKIPSLNSNLIVVF
jgi:hypothetical protein